MKRFLCCGKISNSEDEDKNVIENNNNVPKIEKEPEFEEINVKPIEKEIIDDWGNKLYEYFEEINHNKGDILFENEYKEIYTCLSDKGYTFCAKIIYLNNINVKEQTDLIECMINGIKISINYECNNLVKFLDSYLSYYKNKKCLVIEYEYIPESLKSIRKRLGSSKGFNELIVSKYLKQIFNGLLYLKINDNSNSLK